MSIFSNSNEIKINLDNTSRMSHLFRHVSELKTAKGGYLEGQIIFSSSIKYPIYLRLCLIPAESNEKNPLLLHPNLLNIRIKSYKKLNLYERELPKTIDWNIILKIESDNKVYFIYDESDLRKRFKTTKTQNIIDKSMVNENINIDPLKNVNGNINIGPLNLFNENLENIASLEINPNGDKILNMNKSKLMLTVLTPLQRLSKNGVDNHDVIKQRFQDLYKKEIPLNILKDLFNKSIDKNNINSNYVKLLVEVFDAKTLKFLTSSISEPIINSKDKSHGPIKLHDINPTISCTNGKTKIFVLSFFVLAEDIKPIFIIYDPKKKSIVKNEELENKIIQPNELECSIFNKYILKFNTPKQDWEIVNKIEQLGYQIRVTVYRLSDKRMCDTHFPFKYVRHIFRNDSNSDTYNKSCFCYILNTEKTSKQLPLTAYGVCRRKTEILEYTKNKSNNLSVIDITKNNSKTLNVNLSDIIDSNHTAKRIKSKEIDPIHNVKRTKIE